MKAIVAVATTLIQARVARLDAPNESLYDLHGR